MEHSERGFWVIEDGRLTATLSHPISIAEVAEGSVTASDNGAVIDLAVHEFGRGTGTLAVTDYRRRYEVAGDSMTYEQSMATADVELTRHLRGSLTRATE